MMVKVFEGSRLTSHDRGNLEMPGDGWSEQEAAGVSVSLPGSLTCRGIFCLLEMRADWNFLYKGQTPLVSFTR